LLNLEERILKRITAVQKIEDDLLEEEFNMSEEVLEQFDADFPTKEKVQDWMKQNKNFKDFQERQETTLMDNAKSSYHTKSMTARYQTPN
jgi:predicted nucleotidyltransferase